MGASISIWRYQFEFCDPGGCHLTIPLVGSTLRAYKRGLKALMQFHDRKQTPVTIEISLIGFTKGITSSSY